MAYLPVKEEIFADDIEASVVDKLVVLNEVILAKIPVREDIEPIDVEKLLMFAIDIEANVVDKYVVLNEVILA